MASNMAERVLGALGGRAASAENLGAVYQSELARDRGQRRAAGAFYTPTHVADAVLERTLGPALAARSADEILALRVLDPACGAGVFLTRALLHIERALVSRGRVSSPALRATIASRCLIGVDIDPVAVELAAHAVREVAGDDAAPTLVCGDALLGPLPPADIIVGNPPWGQKEVRYDDEAKRLIRERYVVGRGVLDPFKLFVERAHQHLADGGRWGFVLPDIVLVKNQEPIRQLMLEGSRLEWVIFAGRCFAEVNLDAAIIVGERGAPTPEHEVATMTDLDATPARRAQSTFCQLPGRKLNIFATDDELALVDRLRSLPRLGDRFEVHEGVHSGNRRRALFVAAPQAPSAPLIVGGHEIAPFRLRWRGRYLALAPEVIAKPGYANLGRREWHSRPKVVVRRTGDHIVAATDARGMHVSNNLFVVVPRRAVSLEELDATTAILGSRFMTWYFRTVQPRVGRLFSELKINQLADFPLPRLGTAARRELAALARRAERLGLTDELRDAIDERVDALIGLTAAERTLVTMSHRARSRPTMSR